MILAILARSFLLATSTFLVLCQVLPTVGSRVLPWGKLVLSASAERKEGNARSLQQKQSGLFTTIIDSITAPSISKSLFWHFYAVGVIQIGLVTAVFISSYLLNFPPLADIRGFLVAVDGLFHLDRKQEASENGLLADGLLCVVLMSLQEIRRLYECFYVHRFSPTAQMSAGAYLAAILFYLCVPIALVIDGVEQDSQMLFLLGSRHLFGLVLFVAGYLIQWECHVALARLRPVARSLIHQPQKQQNGTDQMKSSKEDFEYRLPRGGWFDLSICPHFGAEIIIYLALVVIQGGRSITGWCILVWVVVILDATARPTREWYLSQFPSAADTIRRRSLMIPYVY